MLVRSQRVFRVDYELARVARPVLLTVLAIGAAYALPTGTGWESWLSRLGVALGWPLVLVASGFVTPEERVRIQHASWFLQLAEILEPSLTGPGQQAAIQRLARAAPNLRQALDFIPKALARKDRLAAWLAQHPQYRLTKPYALE